MGFVGVVGIELVAVQAVQVIVGLTMIVELLAVGEVTRVLVIAEVVIDGVDVVETTCVLHSSGTKRKK